MRLFYSSAGTARSIQTTQARAHSSDPVCSVPSPRAIECFTHLKCFPSVRPTNYPFLTTRPANYYRTAGYKPTNTPNGHQCVHNTTRRGVNTTTRNKDKKKKTAHHDNVLCYYLSFRAKREKCQSRQQAERGEGGNLSRVHLPAPVVEAEVIKTSRCYLPYWYFRERGRGRGGRSAYAFRGVDGVHGGGRGGTPARAEVAHGGVKPVIK